LPEPIRYESQREFVRTILNREVDLRALGTRFVDKSQEGKESQEYRAHMNSEGSPTEIVAAGYQWSPGTELARTIGYTHDAELKSGTRSAKDRELVR
jgi:hypothetical protein